MGYFFNLWTLLPIPQSSMASRRPSRGVPLAFQVAPQRIFDGDILLCVKKKLAARFSALARQRPAVDASFRCWLVGVFSCAARLWWRSVVYLWKECSVCGGLPSIKPVVCKVTPAEAGVIWQVTIWAPQAGNRAGKTRHHCAVMRPGAQARLQTCTQLSPRHSTFPRLKPAALPTVRCARCPGKGPVGLMDKASASGAGDSRFESWAGH